MYEEATRRTHGSARLLPSVSGTLGRSLALPCVRLVVSPCM